MVRSGGQQAKLEQQIGIPPPTIFSDNSGGKSVCLSITDGSEELSIDKSS